MKPFGIILVVSISIYLIPTYSIGGIPFRIEDLIFLGLILIHKKSDISKDDKMFFTLLYLLPILSLLSIFVQILKGYVPVLGDLNSIFSLVRNAVIFYAGFVLGSKIKVDQQKLFLGLSVGFLISGMACLIQYYNIGGLGNQLFLLYSTEEGLKFGLNRAVGTTGNPNYAAFFQINALILLLFYKATNNMYRIFMWVLLLIIILSVYVTFSRTGLICMILLWLIWLVMEKKYVVLLLIGFISVASLPFISDYSRGTRFETLFAPDKYDPNGNIFTLNGRVDGIWGQKLQYFFDNPLIGISSAKNLRSNTQFEVVTFDNSFIYMLVTGGLIGLILLIIFHYKLIVRFIDKSRYKNRFLFNYLILLHVNIAIFYFTTDLIKMVQFTTFYFFFSGLILTFKNKEDGASDLYTNIKLE